ncbi:hypothetical protein Dsin_020822 [Dipteronia sinensis]|uniref:Uncharacterized protein n=1 Tax=Dipteronia sinensis TaxID=43782 RepID=A0AAE0ABA6_9ROSI|nr:hypothetical protein Dsin_020822 [Dipteronia sinensis]
MELRKPFPKTYYNRKSVNRAKSYARFIETPLLDNFLSISSSKSKANCPTSLCLSCLAAFPLVRHLHHNVFERFHRFAGWTSLALLWVFVVLTISYDPKTKSYSNQLGSRLIKQEEFWFTLAITVLIIIPWLTVRRVPVKISAPSGHASIIKFEGRVKTGILGRISPSPLSEWHAFGIISDGKSEHMMLAGDVGDFTKSLVSNPPSHLWV